MHMNVICLFSIGTMAWIIWICGSVACFILTSTASTQSARLPLLMITFVFALLEYLLVSGIVSQGFCTLLQNWRFIYQDSHNVSIGQMTNPPVTSSLNYKNMILSFISKNIMTAQEIWYDFQITLSLLFIKNLTQLNKWFDPIDFWSW